MKTEFTTPAIERVLGIPRARLKEWISESHITPSVQKADGRGTKHIFSRDDLYVIAVYRQLLEHGVRRSLAGDVVRWFEMTGYTFSEAIAKDYLYLVISRFAPSGEEPKTEGGLMLEIPSKLPPTQEYVWAFNLRNIKETVDRKLV